MSALTGKHVLVLGLGESGLAMARWCALRGARVRVADSRAVPPGWSRVIAAHCRGREVVHPPAVGEGRRVRPGSGADLIRSLGIHPRGGSESGEYLEYKNLYFCGAASRGVQGTSWHPRAARAARIQRSAPVSSR